jgi:carbon monoxide dehydrogenase subunit G
MELKARYTFDATPAHVWAMLMDPIAIAACLPGCQKFEPIGPDRYRVVLTAGVAAVTGTFEGTVSIADKQPEKSYRLVVDGSGRAGFAKGESTITLTPDNNTVTVDVAGVVNVGGLVAQVGQRLIGATARMMMDRFFKCLQARM